METSTGRQELETSSLVVQNTSARKRQSRCYHRVISGLHKPGYLRFLTLTSSKEELNASFQKDFRKLRMRLLRRKLLIDYIRCPEYTKKGYRHEHILFRGSYIEQVYVSKLWDKIHNSPVVDIRRAYGKPKLAGYMAKYMAKAPAGRYSYSWGWVWKGFAKTWSTLKKIAWGDGWDYRHLLTIWRWSVKLNIKIDEVMKWRNIDFMQSVASVQEVFAVILAETYLRRLGSMHIQNTKTG